MFDSDPYDEWMETINKLGELDLSPRPTTVKSLTGKQADSVFSGISTFGRLRYSPCLSSHDVNYDIAFIGAPFDTGTSYRPGARFGPSGIRQGSRHLNL